MMSSCIIAAQLIMLPVALAVGRTADRFGRKPILLLGFAVLPVRAVLYTLSDDAAWLIGMQLLDGVVVDHFGYSAVFLTSSAVACAALATLFLAMPETATGRSGDALAAGAGADG